jgi:hypothetical protein
MVALIVELLVVIHLGPQAEGDNLARQGASKNTGFLYANDRQKLRRCYVLDCYPGLQKGWGLPLGRYATPAEGGARGVSWHAGHQVSRLPYDHTLGNFCGDTRNQSMFRISRRMGRDGTLRLSYRLQTPLHHP